jgi:hypothetical protein
MTRPSTALAFDDVRAMGRHLSGTTDGLAYGSPALKVNGRTFACVPTHKSAAPNSLAVWVPLDQREELLKSAPDIYYVKDHYVDHPIVLVRLSRIHRDALRDLLGMAHRFVAAQRPPRNGRRASHRRRTRG